MNRIVGWAPAIAILLTALGLAAYGVALFLATFVASDGSLGADLRKWFLDNPSANVGIPCSAIAAFAVVTALLRVFPADDKGGPLKLKAFGLEFTGPSGPITLWLLCFLAFVFAIKLLR
jgi:hypothetical protein